MKTEINFYKTSEITEGCWQNRKLLFIDDDLDSILLVKEIFLESGIETITAENGMKGLMLLKMKPDTDLVLLDLRLPDITGYRVFCEINKILPGLPVIAVTADALSDFTRTCRELDFYGFILKPFIVEDLIRIVNIALEFKFN